MVCFFSHASFIVNRRTICFWKSSGRANLSCMVISIATTHSIYTNWVTAAPHHHYLPPLFQLNDQTMVFRLQLNNILYNTMTVIIIICYFTYIATHTKRAEKTSHNLSFSFKESLRFACLRKMFGTSFGNKKKQRRRMQLVEFENWKSANFQSESVLN